MATKLIRKGLSIAMLFILGTQLTMAQSQLIKPEIEAKVDSLLEIMTLEEKVGQLVLHNGTFELTGPKPEGDLSVRYDLMRNGGVGAMLNVIGTENTMAAQKLVVENSRLGIPLMFGYDVIHGFKTIFPIPLAETASWDVEKVQNGARVAATEASAVGITWTFAPMIDITRDARWGRVMETGGEDPFLVSQMAVARVKGFQTDDLSADNSIAATTKHFAAYGFSESGRDYNTVDISKHMLHNVVLPPFKAANDAGVATVMSAFNDLWGIPATTHNYLQNEVLKGDWDFNGFIVTDWGTIRQLVPHGYLPDTKVGSIDAINAGTDMDMESSGFQDHLANLVNEGEVDIKVVDEAVRRILRVKYLLGLFDDPYKYSDPEREKELLYTDEHRAASRDMARRSIVLLENQNDLLPLKKDVKSIAVIGALANDKDSPLGSWRAQGVSNSATSLLEGIQSAVSKNTSVEYAEGYTMAVGRRTMPRELVFPEDDGSGFKKAIEIAKKSDVVVMAVGEEAFQTGEGRSQVDISLRGRQLELLKLIKEVNDNVVVVLMNGRPIAEPWMYENMPTILETWHLGSEGGHAIADVIFGDYNPSAKLPMSIPKHLGQIPIYYNHKSTGRPEPQVGDQGSVYWSHYTDESNEPQYAFGYGLSYTNFEYSNLRMTASSMGMDDEIEVSVDVENTGNMDGEEVVQFYLHDHFASAVRPVQELKGFEKVMIKKGEKTTITFKVNAETLSYYAADYNFKAEPGTFTFMVGGNSTDLLKAEFELLK